MSSIQSALKGIETSIELIAKQSTGFAISGVFDNSQVNGKGLTLYYRSDEVLRCVNVPLSENDLQDLYAVASPSPFGKGNETVLDLSYREARELKPPKFSLSTDVLSSTGMLHLLASKLDHSAPLIAKLNKLNAYTTGGHFKAHKDTPQNNDHIGTLMLCLPSNFTGGDLVIRHNGITVRFDWANQVFSSPVDSPDHHSSGKIAWGFLYSDCEHEVEPVTSGTRITIAYDIYVQPKSAIQADESGMNAGRGSDSRLTMIESAFKSFIDMRASEKVQKSSSLLEHDKDTDMEGGNNGKGSDAQAEFSGADGPKAKVALNQEDVGAEATGGLVVTPRRIADEPAIGILGFGLKHGYPLDNFDSHNFDSWNQMRRYASSLETRMKGIDKILLDSIKQMGLKWEFRAVYPSDDADEYYEYFNKKIPPTQPAFLTANSFFLLEDQYCECLRHEALVNEGAEYEPVKWVVEPTVFSIANHYTTYGNEATTTCDYVGVAIFVYL